MIQRQIMNLGGSRGRIKLCVYNELATGELWLIYHVSLVQVRSSARVSNVCILPGRTNSFAHAISTK
jgi:hypothetical protein